MARVILPSSLPYVCQRHERQGWSFAWRSLMARRDLCHDYLRVSGWDPFLHYA